MRIKDLKELLAQLPAELDEKHVVIREFGPIDEGEKYFKLDKPIGLAYYDETTGELAVTESDMFTKYKDKGWFPVNEGHVMKYDDVKHDVSEDGECAAGPAPDSGFGTVDSVNGMGAPVLASRGVTGSGDVPSVAPTKKKKKRKILSFDKFFTQ